MEPAIVDSKTRVDGQVDLWAWDRRRRLWWKAGIATSLVGFLAITVCVIIEILKSEHIFLTSVLWFGWAVIPPAWFLVEYWASGRRPSLGTEMKNRFDEFKYSQDLAAKLWVGNRDRPGCVHLAALLDRHEDSPRKGVSLPTTKRGPHELFGKCIGG
jgi:hypothetical protein